MSYFFYREVKRPKISYIFEKTLVLSIICNKCGNEDEKIVKEEESVDILKTLGFNKYIELLEKHGWRKQKPSI